MVDCSSPELVCLHLDSLEGAGDRTPAPRAVTATGIAAALELDDTAVGRVAVLGYLETAVDEGLVRAGERPVRGYERPRSVYELTAAGARRADAVRERVAGETVVLTGEETAETVPLSVVDRYFEDHDAPLVTALARLEDGEVPLEKHAGEGFVDRTAELDALTDGVTTAFRGRSQTVVVGGPSGMGKSALVREAVDAIREDYPDLVVARGASPAGVTEPYAALEDAFDALPGGEDIQSRLTAAREQAAGGAGSATGRRRALFEAIAEDLRATATERPVVVVLENLQWAGEATLALFAHLATAIDELVYPVAFVGTYRTPAVAGDDDHSLGPVLDRLHDEAGSEELRLESLSRPDTRALAAEVLGRYRVPDGFLDLVYEQTGGNPLFVRETTAHLLETGAVDPGAGEYPTDSAAVDLPGEVTAQIERRLRNLDEDSRTLLRQAAVLGERVPGRVLAEMSDVPAADRREYVDVLVDSRVWEPVGTGGDVDDDAPVPDGSGDLAFVSGGLREAVVERLPDALTNRYHRRAAQAFLAVHGEDSDEHAARIAHHYDEAGDVGAAVTHYLRAADYAFETYAHEAAIEHYERAIELGEEQAETDEAGLVQGYVGLARVSTRTSAYERTLDVVEDGLAIVDEHSRERCRLLVEKVQAQIEQSEFDRARATAREHRAVAREAGIRDHVAKALQELGLIAEYRADYERARERYGSALSIAREVGNVERESVVLDGLGMVAQRQDDYEQAREYLQASLDIREDRGDRFTISATLNNLGLVATSTGEFDRAREHYQRALEIEREDYDRRGQAISVHNLGELAHELGEYERARERYEESLAIERDLGNRGGAAISLRFLGDAAADQSDLDDAREYYQESLDIAQDIGIADTVAAVKRGLGELDLAAGDDEAASERFEDAVESFEEQGNESEAAATRRAAAELALANGETDRARDRAQQAHATYVDVGAPLRAARSQRLLGLIAADGEGTATARDHLTEALETFEDLGATRDALETLRDLRAACHEAGDDGAAEAWRERAESVLADAPESIASDHREWVQSGEGSDEGNPIG